MNSLWNKKQLVLERLDRDGPQVRAQWTGFCAKPDRIEPACVMLAKQVAQRAVDRLHEKLRAGVGEALTGKTMVCILRPGLLPVSAKKKLTNAFVELL